jgi:hypothetical protein
MFSPSVLSITTTSKGRSPASVNSDASSLNVTLKFFSAPIAWMPVLPASMDSVCLKPVVFEKTSTS